MNCLWASTDEVLVFKLRVSVLHGSSHVRGTRPDITALAEARVSGAERLCAFTCLTLHPRLCFTLSLARSALLTNEALFFAAILAAVIGLVFVRLARGVANAAHRHSATRHPSSPVRRDVTRRRSAPAKVLHWRQTCKTRSPPFEPIR